MTDYQERLREAGVRQCTYFVPEELHRRLKVRAVEEGRTISSVVVEACETLLHEQTTPRPTREGAAG